MIKVVYKKPLKESSQITFYIDNNILTATVCDSYLIRDNYFLYFNNGHEYSVNILVRYFNDSLYNIFEPIVTSALTNAIWPYSTLEDLEKILDNFSIFEEF